MKSAITIGLAALTASAVSAGLVNAAPVAQTSKAPCKPSTSKIEGGAAVNYCGPATATLRVRGKTYTFKNGFCQSLPGFEDDITLGTFAKGKGGRGRSTTAGSLISSSTSGPARAATSPLPTSGAIC